MLRDVVVVAAAVPDSYRALIVFAAGMGMRQGECFGLTVDRGFVRQIRSGPLVPIGDM